MNYTKDDLIDKDYLIKDWDGKSMEVLAWNNDQQYEPCKYQLIGVHYGEDGLKWVVKVYYQDGWDKAYKDFVARVPTDWTPYIEPKQIPLFECEVGKRYRVKGVCGMDFDRIMYCVQADPNKGYLFGTTMDDKKLIGDAWINEVYICEK